ncbi:unnamed protein product, partial [marine sediment metagenome]
RRLKCAWAEAAMTEAANCGQVRVYRFVGFLGSCPQEGGSRAQARTAQAHYCEGGGTAAKGEKGRWPPKVRTHCRAYQRRSRPLRSDKGATDLVEIEIKNRSSAAALPVCRRGG